VQISQVLSALQYQKLYREVADENLRLRTENGDISQALNGEMLALQNENRKLQSQLEVAESDLIKASSAFMETAHEQHKKVQEAGEDEIDNLQADENIFEVQIIEGSLNVDSQVNTFFTLDFYDHATQVSSSRRWPNDVGSAAC
jgi:hypothetical protein